MMGARAGDPEPAGPSGLIVAAPASDSGKTVTTLGLLRALTRAGAGVAGAKAGPDYIDPAFHAAACGRPSFNLDPWAMRRESLASILALYAREAELVLCEGVMGLFDGAKGGAGSTAELAALTSCTVTMPAMPLTRAHLAVPGCRCTRSPVSRTM